jgi:hypothetical protein
MDYRPAYLEEYFTHEDERGKYQLITCTAPGDRINTRAHYDWRGQLPPPGRHWAWKREQMEAFEAEGRLMYSTNGIPRLKRYVQDGQGVPLQDIWTDINRLDAHSEERIGYETQKPLALLDRIVRASSQPDDIVLDPFCGTGTSLVAAERAGRSWIGVDQSLLACSISLSRVRQDVQIRDVGLHGFPADEKAALALRRSHPSAFGLWVTSMLATLADRKVFTGSLTAGVGSVHVGRRQWDLLSWVPLRSNLDPAIPSAKLGRLAKAGFILRSGRGDAGLRKWLEKRTDIPMHDVLLDGLVAADSHKKGIAPDILRVTSAAS